MPSAVQLTIPCLDVDGKKYSKDLWQGGLEIPARLTIGNTNKKLQMTWKKNWTPSLRSTEESTINQNSFRVLSILYVANFCETRLIFEYFLGSTH